MDFRPEENLFIDYLGKGWDGSYLSHGSAVHESYKIPWNEIIEFKPTKRVLYRDKIVDNQEYRMLRNNRIQDLIQRGVDSSIAESAIPETYGGMSNLTFQQINDDVILKMYLAADKFKKYKEYITIVQVENNRIVVPEIILLERLRIKERICGGIEI